MDKMILNANDYAYLAKQLNAKIDYVFSDDDIQTYDVDLIKNNTYLYVNVSVIVSDINIPYFVADTICNDDNNNVLQTNFDVSTLKHYMEKW